MVPARYILAILGSVGMAIVYGLKVNLSVAMVIMVNSIALKNETFNNQEASCQASLADLRLSLLSASNQTNEISTIQEQIANTTTDCIKITQEIRNLTEQAKSYTESQLNEVNMLKCASVQSE